MAVLCPWHRAPAISANGASTATCVNIVGSAGITESVRDSTPSRSRIWSRTRALCVEPSCKSLKTAAKTPHKKRWCGDDCGTNPGVGFAICCKLHRSNSSKALVASFLSRAPLRIENPRHVLNTVSKTSRRLASETSAGEGHTAQATRTLMTESTTTSSFESKVQFFTAWITSVKATCEDIVGASRAPAWMIFRTPLSAAVVAAPPTSEDTTTFKKGLSSSRRSTGKLDPEGCAACSSIASRTSAFNSMN
mmetsp:Transcript_35762/g.80385  ORF Transcript_35762/g.80385 Transcript_35762/m.80385 type:complete len:250 (-) Transcript_35762:247-996(-)